ncbi:MAG: hypothetical protein RML45_02560 [Acetobacteraceae bacterium]|nr:hypothetical protein [Acetobacteraceae bacterium]
MGGLGLGRGVGKHGALLHAADQHLPLGEGGGQPRQFRTAELAGGLQASPTAALGQRALIERHRAFAGADEDRPL